MKVIIISLCFFAVGGGILCAGINNLMTANQATSWPTTEGTITSSTCVYYYVMNECSSYFTHANYRYTVAGKSYNGDRIAFGYTGSWWRRPHQNIADRLSSSTTVLVRYNPDTPSTAVLACGLNGSTALTLYAGSWIMLVSSIAGFRALRSRNKAGMVALSSGPNRFTISIQGWAGIVLLVVAGMILGWSAGLLSDCGIISTLVIRHG